MLPRASIGKWDMGYAVGVGMGKEKVFLSCCAASRVIVKVTTGR